MMQPVFMLLLLLSLLQLPAVTHSELLSAINSMCSTHHHSCVGHCGNVSRFQVDLHELDLIFPCSCDFRCAVYDDCCQDFHKSCSQESDRFYKSNLKRLVGSRFKCFPAQMLPPGLAVSSCPKVRVKRPPVLKASSHVVEEFEEPDLSTSSAGNGNPSVVTDLSEGITYINKEVYRCNNPQNASRGDEEAQLVTWMWMVQSYSEENLEDLSRFLASGANASRFYLTYMAPTSLNGLTRTCRGFGPRVAEAYFLLRSCNTSQLPVIQGWG